MGSIHLPHDAVEWNTAYVLNAIDHCDGYCGEMNLDSMQNEGFKGQNILPEGKSLSDYFSSFKHFNKSRNSLKKSFGIDIENFKYLKPMLIQPLLDRVIMGGSEEVMDVFLWNYAKNKKIPCNGLESLDEQLKVLQSISISDQVEVLKKISSNTKAYKKKLHKLGVLYNLQDIKGIYKHVKRSSGKYRKLLLYDRNIKMTKSILQLPIGDYVIVMGAGHLFGNQGLLALLKRGGGKVSKVKQS
jgi:uncharacterized protein YbaP (TraB family)